MLLSLVSIGGFLSGSVFLYYGMSRWKRAQLIRNTPTEAVSSAAVGRSEIQGTANPVDHTLSQPFVEGECLYTWYKIEEYRRNRELNQSSRSSGRSWDTLDEGSVFVPFVIDDGTGIAEVDVNEDPDVLVSSDHQEKIHVGTRDREPDAVREYLQHNGFEELHSGISGMVAGTRRRYWQSVLPVDETVYVFGSVETQEGSDIPVITRDDETGEFIISDSNADTVGKTLHRESAFLSIVGVALFVMTFYTLLFGLPIPG